VAGVLAGEVGIVTGAGRGFGRELALRLAHEGAAVGVISRNRAELDAVAAEIEASGGKAFAATADVVDRAQVEAAVTAVQAALGPVSLLVNNAGLDRPFGPIGHVDPDEWWATISIHVRHPLLFMTALLPAMLERGKGHIVNIASLGGRVVEPNMSAYAVGKAAEIRLTEHVAAETRGRGIGVFAIEPGTVITSMGASTLANPEAQRWIPRGIEFLKAVQAAQADPAVRDAVFRRCGDMVVSLLSGRYDVLSGRYLEPQDDFDALAADAAAAEQPS
jgi:NAD(P)-dependent dehydrogenase (short-subunit alcohol dehydrogenase family)